MIIIIIILVVISENFIIYSIKPKDQSKKRPFVSFKTNSLHISKCLISSSSDDAKETY